jgi:hypothetical protein
MKQSYLTVSGTIFALALAFAAQACSSSSDATPAAAGTGNTAGTGNPGTGGTGTAGTGTAGTGTAGTDTGGTGAGPIASLAACTSEAKGATCTNEGTACKKTCGPQSYGWKSETCQGGLIVEGKTCEFTCSDTSIDWSCYSLSAGIMCDTVNVPVASAACTADACMPCSGTYMDSSMAAKAGSCVCVQGASGGKWSCASSTAWPTCVQ